MSSPSASLEPAAAGPGRTESAPLSPGVIMIVGFAIIAVYLTGIFLAMSYTTYDLWGAMFIGPVLVALTLPALSRQAAREGDRRLFWLLLAALLLKLVMAAVAHYVAFHVYRGVADAIGYHRGGIKIAQRFRAGNYHTGLDNLSGTNFPSFLNGLLYTVTGATSLGDFLFYAWLAFWGLFFAYRAFTIAVPEGRSRTYARLLFFLPSQLFWSALAGKEPWMVFGLGIALLGAARFFTGRILRGVCLLALGMWFIALVRPHVAAMVGLALAAAFLARPMPKQFRHIAPVVKGAGFALLLLAGIFMFHYTQRYLQARGIDTHSGLTHALEETSQGAAYGGSAFQPAIVRTPLGFPKGVITVLFRPFITETHSTLERLAGLEDALVLLFVLWRIPWIVAALKSIRRQPYILFALAYMGMFCYAFSAFANFGLLIRERVQLTPIALVLLAVPPKKKEAPSESLSESLTSPRSI